VTTGSLGEHLVTLAGTPDDDPAVPADLIIIAQLATDRIVAVSYASITRYQPGGWVTVAASSDLALAVDEAQYADGAGPCLETLDTGHVTEVPDISATMAWPGFRDTASALGLRASLSIPLFAARGTAIAALNLYSHDPAAMRPLSRIVESVYGLDETDPPPEPSRNLGAGAKSLLAGLTGAFAVRAILQQAIGVLMAETAASADQAYDALCRRAVDTGIALPQAASRVITGQRW
jgi:GAF domain/ANTAR domain